MPFKEVSPQPNFVQNEQETLAWWYKARIVDRYLHRNDDSKEKFRFLDGPITANNPMGVHHAHGRTIKDFFQRYKNMQGFKQRFQNGFDSQGLWVEVEVERDLGLNSKREIEEFGLEEFSKACRERVEKFSAVQTEQSKRLGMFMDWGNDYYTMSDRNNEHIWHFLKTCHERGLIYQGQGVMPWCVRCGTAISQHELSDGGYQEVEHDSVYVKFPVSGLRGFGPSREIEFQSKLRGASFLVWTTTPWTLPANTALAVNPDEDYVRVEAFHLPFNISGRASYAGEFIVAKSAAESLWKLKEADFEFVAKGIDLEGLTYEPPFEFASDKAERHYQVVTADFVGTDEGTGIVHIAPGAGKEDFELSQEYNLAVLAPLDEFGTYLNGFGDFSDKDVWEVNREVVKKLKDDENIKLVWTEKITHTYPHCWRCKEELVFRLTDEWFIKMDPLRQGLKEAAEKVNWLPSFAGKRMQDWLDSMGDWPISRRRYWGLALPIFESEDGKEFYVVGSKKELRELALEPEIVDQLPELHRPWIDEIRIKSPKTQKTLNRIAAVGDAWLDAGIVPFSTVDYLTDRDYWQAWYPFDLIAEYLSQVRLWFYSTLVMSYVLEKQAPWKNVIASGYVVDEKGEEMHKSRGNTIEFNEAADKAGADAMRWLYLREKVANYHGAGKMRFGYNHLDDVRRRFFMILWNSYRFFVSNTILDGWKPREDYELGRRPHPELAKVRQQSELDRWLLSRLNNLVKFATQTLDQFNSPDVAAAIENFVVNDFSQWYLRRSRDRVGPTAEDSADKENFYSTSYRALLTLATLLAPFTPFLAEEIYQNLRTREMPESVHLLDWPKVDSDLIDKELEDQMQLVREIVEKGHAVRKKVGIRVRQPLARLTVAGLPAKKFKLLKNLIRQELNVKEVQISEGKGGLQVTLDTEITDELKREGYAREIIRAVQDLRREAGYNFDDEILVYYGGDPELVDVVQEFAAELKQKLLAKRLELLVADQANLPSEASAKEGATLDLNGHTLYLSATRVNP